MKEMPSTGAFLRSSVHFEQISFRVFRRARETSWRSRLRIDAVVIDHEKPDHRLAVLDLLPQPRGRRLGDPPAPPRRSATRQALLQSKPAIGSASRNLDTVSPHHHPPDQCIKAMGADYGHFADGSSARDQACGVRQQPDTHRDGVVISQGNSVTAIRADLVIRDQLTPSFFCRLDDDVVYWNTSRLSG